MLDRLLLGLFALAEFVLAADAAEVCVLALQGGQQWPCRGSIKVLTQKPLAEQHSSLAHFLFLFLGPHLTAGFDGLMKGLSQ